MLFRVSLTITIPKTFLGPIVILISLWESYSGTYIFLYAQLSLTKCWICYLGKNYSHNLWFWINTSCCREALHLSLPGSWGQCRNQRPIGNKFKAMKNTGLHVAVLREAWFTSVWLSLWARSSLESQLMFPVRLPI